MKLKKSVLVSLLLITCLLVLMAGYFYSRDLKASQDRKFEIEMWSGVPRDANGGRIE